MTYMTQKDLIILEIYNRYSCGEITTEERDLLFDKCEEVFNEVGNIFINDDRVEYNCDTLRPNSNNNILFITGFSGSGKSTLMDELYEKYQNTIIQISGDFFFMTCIYKYRKTTGVNNEKFGFETERSRQFLGPILTRYFDIYYDSITLSYDKFSNPELLKYWEHFILWLYDDINKNKYLYRNKIIVVEGVQISNTNPELYKDHAVIITGTSALVSYARKANRDIIIPKKYDWKHMKTLLTMIPVYIKDIGNINRLQKTMEMFDESTKYDKYLNDVNEIISKLSKEESNYIGRGQRVDSEYVIYRKVEYNDNIPIAFIDVYLMPKYENTGLIVIAVSKDARGKGIGKELVKGAINSLKSNKDIDRLRWKVDSNNKISINMAESLGFELSETTKKEKIYYYNL